MKQNYLVIILFLFSFSLESQVFQKEYTAFANNSWKGTKVTGGFISSGRTTNGVQVTFFDGIGDPIWTYEYILGTNPNPGGCIQTQDGNFLCYGNVDIGANQDIFLMKIDQLGNIMWDHTYSSTLGKELRLFALKELANGDFFVSSAHDMWNHGPVQPGGQEAYLFRTSSAGNVIWSQSYKFNNRHWSYLGSLEEDPNGNLYAAGRGGHNWDDHPLSVVCLSANGTPKWNRSYRDNGAGWCWMPPRDLLFDNGELIVVGRYSNHNQYGTGGSFYRAYILSIDTSTQATTFSGYIDNSREAREIEKRGTGYAVGLINSLNGNNPPWNNVPEVVNLSNTFAIDSFDRYDINQDFNTGFSLQGTNNVLVGNSALSPFIISTDNSGNTDSNCVIPAVSMSMTNYTVVFDLMTISTITDAVNQNVISFSRQNICFTVANSCSITVDIDTVLVCENDTAFFNTNDTILGATYNWTGTGTLSNYILDSSSVENVILSDSGMYTCEVYVNGCLVKTYYFYLQARKSPKPNLGNDTVICGNSQITLNPGTYSSYLWSNSSVNNSITVNTSGAYFVRVDSGGCYGYDTVNITIEPNPTINLGNDTNLCDNNQLILTPGNFTTYRWQNGSQQPFYAVSNPGTYWVIVNENSCPASDTINITYSTTPSLDLGQDLTICGSGPYMLTGGQFDSYLWNTGATTSEISVINSGMYSLTVNASSCPASDTININFVAVPNINLGNDTLLLCGDNGIILSPSNPFPVGYSAIWQDGSTGVNYFPKSSGKYWVRLTSNTGNCVVADSINILFDCNIFVPNTISADANGVNEFFQVYTEADLEEFSMLIFNRWGELIYQFNDVNDFWDGTYQGNPVKQDVYVWKMEYKRVGESNADKKIIHGHLNVLR